MDVKHIEIPSPNIILGLNLEDYDFIVSCLAKQSKKREDMRERWRSKNAPVKPLKTQDHRVSLRILNPEVLSSLTETNDIPIKLIIRPSHIEVPSS